MEAEEAEFAEAAMAFSEMLLTKSSKLCSVFGFQWLRADQI